MSKIRTFIAVDVAPKVRTSAGRLISRLEASGAPYNWLNSEHLHVTLNFLGDVPEYDIPEVCKRVRKAVESVPGFSLEIAGLGCFPKPDRPRIIWMGVEDGTDALVALNESLTEELLQMGFPRDRHDYHPHLTLGRLRRGGNWNQALVDGLNKHADYPAGGCYVDQVVVYSSYLDRTGPTYTPMSRIPLL